MTSLLITRVPLSFSTQTNYSHAPDTQVGNDAVPTFSAQVLPAGSAPADRTFQPNPISETPGQANNDDTLRSDGKESTYTSADSTLGGTTSEDMHTELGRPMSGQTASDSKGRQGGGLAGVGVSGAESGNQMTDERDDERQRGLEREPGGLAGKNDSADTLGAEEQVPVSAEELAAEKDKGGVRFGIHGNASR